MMFLRWLRAVLEREFPDRPIGRSRLRELGAVSGRAMLLGGVGGLALLSLGLGITQAVTGGTTTTTTTTVAPTTTTAPPTTTTTTVPPTTTTTTGGGDPCLAANGGIPGFPCLANTGVHGVTFTAANTIAHDATHCTVCPPGLIWTPSNGYRFTNCAVVNRWKFNDYVDVFATNGNRAVGLTEAATISQACVRITNSLFAPPEPGIDGVAMLDTGFSGGCCGHQCTFNGVQAPCGPVYLADSEISVAQPRTSFNYATWDTNLHLWRDYLHGGPQGIDSDGFSEVHDSYLRADRSEAAMTGAAHGDAYFQDSGTGNWIFVDHNTLFCGAQEIDCNRDGAYVNDATPTGGTVKSNLFLSTGGTFFCASTGIDQSRAKPAHPFGSNINFKDNVFQSGASGFCGTPGGGVIDDMTLSVAQAHNDHFCNNRYSTGALVNPAWETGSCP